MIVTGVRTRVQTSVQTSLSELGTPLRDVTFVIVDLETTGGAPAEAGITEIGAVRVRAGEVLGEFQTLVNPGTPIPPFVAALTGITDATVATAPRLGAVLPSFLEFLGDGVLVAHNAPYDAGFLRAACRLHDHAWPDPAIVDTARLARVALHRDETRNCKLSTLAAHFHAGVTPTHRALDDARATTDVLHGLLGRVADFGVTTLEDLREFTGRVSRSQRTKRHLADGLPDTPGVYVFRDAQGDALYVGTSKHIRTRVRSYFTASEQRRRMGEMVRIAERVDPIPCATALEARVREIRLIASEQPRYNIRSRRPHTQPWLKLTAEPAPRLSIVREVADDQASGARYLGPFSSRQAAEAARDLLQLAFPVRACSVRIARRPRALTPACALAELGRCAAPCSAGGDRISYDAAVEGLRAVMEGALSPAVAAAEAKMTALVAEERYEDARRWRDRLSILAEASLRTHRLATLAGAAEIVAAAPTPDGGWEIHLIRHGRLAGAAHARPGTDPRPVVEALVAAGDHVEPGHPPAPAGLPEEATEILRWLDSPGVRLVRSGAPIFLPVDCGGATVTRLGTVRRASQRWAISDDEVAATARPRGPADGIRVSRILGA